MNLPASFNDFLLEGFQIEIQVRQGVVLDVPCVCSKLVKFRHRSFRSAASGKSDGQSLQ